MTGASGIGTKTTPAWATCRSASSGITPTPRPQGHEFKPVVEGVALGHLRGCVRPVGRDEGAARRVDDERADQNLVPPHRASPRDRRPGGDGRDPSLHADVDGSDGRIMGSPPRDDGVDLPVRQRGRGVVHPTEAYVEADRVAAGLDELGGPRIRPKECAAHREPRWSLVLLQRRVDGGERTPNRPDQGLPGCGHRHPARRPIDEARAESRLEGLHGAGDPRLREPEFCGGTGEAARLREGDEDPELTQGHVHERTA